MEYRKLFQQQLKTLEELGEQIENDAGGQIEESPKNEHGMFINQELANDTFAAVLAAQEIKAIVQRFQAYLNNSQQA
ncbi:hypothetical protein PI95_022910 [Hassallia byssoidea VB512170]|jgi:hypothetical protein|uniref:Uncharacterized protein n=1 Tax=Hassallia byssoidea VB512170 TaxID=1304833 RepID=A0A846HCR1_9CYAN|nr:hypothetical protein [Hassalia byssoidea]MBW4567413.1 hypothetical protein [Tolypothrix carrinoi HA7290-LM1]NEU75327.1 hypothetical protein [Hassalia byssoidea VB512170]